MQCSAPSAPCLGRLPPAATPQAVASRAPSPPRHSRGRPHDGCSRSSPFPSARQGESDCNMGPLSWTLALGRYAAWQQSAALPPLLRIRAFWPPRRCHRLLSWGHRQVPREAQAAAVALLQRLTSTTAFPPRSSSPSPSQAPALSVRLAQALPRSQFAAARLHRPLVSGPRLCRPKPPPPATRLPLRPPLPRDAPAHRRPGPRFHRPAPPFLTVSGLVLHVTMTYVLCDSCGLPPCATPGAMLQREPLAQGVTWQPASREEEVEQN